MDRSKEVRALVFSFADTLSEAPPTEDLVWRFVKERFPLPMQRKAMSFAMWLKKTGTTDPTVIVRILARAREIPQPTWHRYFAPGGQARESIANVVMGSRAMAESEFHKRSELDFVRRG